MTRLAAALAIMVALPLEATDASPVARYAVLAPTLSPGVRVMGFNIHVTGGQVAALPTFPIGWTVEVVNDPNWTAAVDGHAIVGAAALDAGEFSKLIVLQPEPEDVSESIGGSLNVSGSLTSMRNGELTTRPWLRIRLAPDSSQRP